MLTKYFIEFVVFLVGQVLSLVSSMFPEFESMSILSDAINSLLGMSTQVQNFLYFIFGDFLYAATTYIAILLPLKFVAVPVLSFVRKIFVWGGKG